MKHTPFFIPLLVGSLTLVSSNLTAQVISLPDATRLMLSYEPELNATEYDTLSAIADIQVQRAERLPEVKLDGSVGVSNRDRSTDGLLSSGDSLFSRRLGISLRQLLYDGGSARNLTHASENAMKAQQYLEKDMIEQRVVDLSETYLEVLRIRKLLSNSKLNTDNHAKILQMIGGTSELNGTRTDESLVRSRLSRSKKRTYNLELEDRRAKSRYTRLTGSRNFNFVMPNRAPVANDFQKVTLEDNWAYLAASEALEEVEHRAKATKAYKAPKFYFDAGYSVGEDVSGIRGRDNEAQAMIVGEWTLYNGRKNRSLEKRDHFQVGKFEELKRAADLDRKDQLNVLWEERLANYNSLELEQTHSSQLKGIIDDYEKQFAIGKVDLIKILDRQTEYYESQSDLVNSQYDLRASSYRIYGLQGKLTEWLLSDRGRSTQYMAGDGSKNPINSAIPVSLDYDDEIKDVRVPLTQPDLMKRAFDGEGPSTGYEPAPMEKYYDKPTNSRPGIFKQSWFDNQRVGGQNSNSSPYLNGGPSLETPASVTVMPVSSKKRKWFQRKK